MVQKLKRSKLETILAGAGHVFGLVGYRRAMMSDIAEESGVALGTLYRYAESKEELFELALRHALGEAPAVSWDAFEGPIFETSLFAFVRDFVGPDSLPELGTAVQADAPEDVRAELETIVTELYEQMLTRRVAIRMIDRSANDWPELAALYAEHVRGPLVQALEEYLGRRVDSGLLTPPPDLSVAARYVVETCATLAMHRHFTTGGNYASDEVARATAVHFISRGFSTPR